MTYTQINNEILDTPAEQGGLRELELAVYEAISIKELEKDWRIK